MVEKSPAARFTVVTLGVADMRRSIAFYERLGFARKMRATGEEVAFFETGASVLALYRWDKLAADALLPDQPRPQAFRGVTLAWNCSSPGEVDAVMVHALAQGARLLKAGAPDRLRRIFGIFCRSGRSPVGSGGRARHRGHGRWPRAAARLAGLHRLNNGEAREFRGCAGEARAAPSAHESRQGQARPKGPKGQDPKGTRRTRVPRRRARSRRRSRQAFAASASCSPTAYASWPVAMKPAAVRSPDPWSRLRSSSIPTRFRAVSTIRSG